MFKQRLITALVLVPLVFLALYYSNLTCFTAVAVFVLIACGMEWLQLIPLTNGKSKLIFLLAMLVGMALIHLIFNIWLGLGFFIWLLISLAICTFPKTQQYWSCPYRVAAVAIVLLPLFAQSLINIYMQPNGKALIVFLLLLVWAADIGAYLAGKLCGQHKLIPNVSPGKTIEGLLGGAVLCLLVGVTGYLYFQPHPQSSLVPWLIMTGFVFVMALVGDLFISMLKRHVGIKDTGNIFPGHGGILDRLDSLIAAAPAFYFMYHVVIQGT